MNALFLLFVWAMTAISGGDPCDNAQYATAYADECGQEEAVTVMRRPQTSVTDISNGF